MQVYVCEGDKVWSGEPAAKAQRHQGAGGGGWGQADAREWGVGVAGRVLSVGFMLNLSYTQPFLLVTP
eukprot:118269-Chlamydomonas_euryale.AAC.1